MGKTLERLANYLPPEIIDQEGMAYSSEELLEKLILALALGLQGNHSPLDKLFASLPDEATILTTPISSSQNLNIMQIIRSQLDNGNLVVEKQAGQLKVRDRAEEKSGKLDLTRLIAHTLQDLRNERQPEKITSIHLVQAHLVTEKTFAFLINHFPNLKSISIDSAARIKALEKEVVALLRKNQIAIKIRKPTQNQPLAS